MRKRLVQIFGFLLTSLGWVFVLCTMAMDYWRITQIGGQGGSFIIKVAWYWSNLWKDCFTDSTAVTNCRDFPVLWAVTLSRSVLHYYMEAFQFDPELPVIAFVQGVRGLLMCGITLGFFAVVLCFIGMECTYIGGAEKIKDKLVFAGAVFHFVGGISSIAGYCLYINRIARTTFAPSVGPGVLRYDIGPPIFLGLVGCFLIFLGAVFYAVTVCYVLRRESQVVYATGGGTYMYPGTRGRSLYTGYYRPSKLYGTYMGSRLTSSSKISKISQTTPTNLSERDAFV